MKIARQSMKEDIINWMAKHWHKYTWLHRLVPRLWMIDYNVIDCFSLSDFFHNHFIWSLILLNTEHETDSFIFPISQNNLPSCTGPFFNIWPSPFDLILWINLPFPTRAQESIVDCFILLLQHLVFQIFVVMVYHKKISSPPI